MQSNKTLQLTIDAAELGRYASSTTHMAKRLRYHDHVDPDYQQWGRTYRSFPGVEECVRLILARKTKGSMADIIHHELAENAGEHLAEMIDSFNDHAPGDVALYMMMALETAALPDSVEFLSGVLRGGDKIFATYAKRALVAIDTKESRTVLFNATDA